MECHSAPGLFCSLPMGLSCLFRSWAPWDLSLALLLWAPHTTELLSQLLPWQSSRTTLTIAVGHWEFPPPVPLELDKAHGPFETHQSQCCSGAVLQDMVSWNVRGRRQEQSQTLFPQNNLWDGFSRASTAISWQRMYLGLGWCLTSFQEQITSKGCAQTSDLPLLCYLLQLHFQLLLVPCTCLVGQNKTACQTKRGLECLNIVQGSCRCEIWGVLHQGFVRRCSVKEMTAFSYCGLSAREGAEGRLCPQPFSLQPHKSKSILENLFQVGFCWLLISKLARNAPVTI